MRKKNLQFPYNTRPR
ncbi:hypothetical protein E2C01_092640 [Portunus trituberculatus]|uniref:Uncharacterized protein n=1 Tax=Portunus trituberculatus TaxID=210409 RepID=A0A5B7JR33_PORTR|nr:hypothetical protein [Portunus trituberculatus]